MTIALFMELSQKAMWVALALAAPLLIISMSIGLVVSIFQALTQINEATLSFVPKMVALVASLTLLGPWMLQVLLTFTSQLLTDLPHYVR